VTDYFIAALVSVLVGAASAVFALVQSLTSAGPQGGTRVDGPLGTGPHTAHDCMPNAQSVAAAARLAQQLREATRAEHWTLDWGRFDAMGKEAQTALAAGDFTAAVRNHALSISLMMSEIRRQAARKDRRDSSVLDL